MQKSWLLALVVLFGGALALSACNTMQGAGEDIQAAGDALSDSAEEVQDDM